MKPSTHCERIHGSLLRLNWLPIITMLFLASIFARSCAQSGHSWLNHLLQIGEKDLTQTSADWDEFTNTDLSTVPIHLVGSDNLSTISPWIGHNSAATNESRYQRFRLDDLQVDKEYVLIIHPASVVGAKTYSATIVDGNATIVTGERHAFLQDGFLNIPETWRIEIAPSTSSVTLEIGNSLVSGENYLYFDWFLSGEKTVRVASQTGAYIIGHRENFGDTTTICDELKSHDLMPEHLVGSHDLQTVRPWIGHNESGSGTPKKQRFSFTDLIPGTSYWLTVYPGYTHGNAIYRVLVPTGEAQIVEGAEIIYKGNRKLLDIRNRWAIKFVPSTPAVTLELGHDELSGPHCLYINWYAFSPEAIAFEDVSPLAFSADAMQKDTGNGGDWYKDAVYNVESGSYMWGQGYVMNSYVYLYQLTHDDHWLEKLVDHADAVLAQRDSETGNEDCYGESPPSWQDQNDGNGGYVWIGFTGALFDPIVEFAAMVLESPYLSSRTFAWLAPGQTLGDKALEYVEAFQLAVDYHESEWVEDGQHGYYIFQPDLCSVCQVAGGTPLENQPAAYDMISLMVGALLDLAKAYAAVGDARATVYFDKVAKYATYFKSTWTYKTESGGYYYWLFAIYYGSLDDIGHANFNVRFVADCYREGIVYTPLDMQRIANTFARLIQPDYAIPYNVMTAEYHTNRGHINNATFYWNFAAPYKAELFARANARARLTGFTIYDYATLPFVFYTDPTYMYTDSPVAVHDSPQIAPETIVLNQNYPNPFNPTTAIEFAIHEKLNVKLTIFDINGRQVEVVINKELPPGTYHFNFNAGALASGIYLYKVEAGDFIQTRKMILLR
ncbi:T9SS type A sorting domain-containing protein [candidate division KSB1 bacterium]|nr:T9SS type A sorting domain-containing protein [candidate division KSB1 bacterium]